MQKKPDLIFRLSLIHLHASFKTFETNGDRIYERVMKIFPPNRLSHYLNSSAPISSIIISEKDGQDLRITYKSFTFIQTREKIPHRILQPILRGLDLAVDARSLDSLVPRSIPFHIQISITLDRIPTNFNDSNR
ncbi:hypothetical protein P8910_20930 [Bacillus atrophaeus]|nr:hypothetical protein [Bacillus atrophaeus]MEC0833069.1 hypothetical protein [Bacillus atrophaeus]MEC0908025.1 hypothetical protein [Bacillus atrophaeus]